MTNTLLSFATKDQLRNLLVAVILACTITPASASIDISFIETTGGVRVVGSGSLDTLDGLLSNGPATGFGPFAGYVASRDRSGVVSSAGTLDSYTPTAGLMFTSPSGGGSSFRQLAGDPGVTVGFLGDTGRLNLPTGYAAGTLVNFSVDTPGLTLQSFGFVAGDTWNASWDTGNSIFPTQSIDFNARAVPEPSSFLLLLGGITGLAAIRHRRRESL